MKLIKIENFKRFRKQSFQKYLILALIVLLAACSQVQTQEQTQEVEIPQVIEEEIVYKEIEVTIDAEVINPDTIEVNKGDYVKLIISPNPNIQDLNETNVVENIAFVIADYDIEERIAPTAYTMVEFLADKEGEFRYHNPYSSEQRPAEGLLIVN